MEITKGTVRNLGSCNFCDRGKYAGNRVGLIYPYTHVYKMQGRGISVNACFDCLKSIPGLVEREEQLETLKEIK
jgi:hypothetical protein